MENLPTWIAVGELVLGGDASKTTLTCTVQSPNRAFVSTEFASDTIGIPSG